MTLALLSAMRGLGTTPPRVGRPHGAEGGYDPYRAYENVSMDNFYEYLNGIMLPPEHEGEWVRGRMLRCPVPRDLLLSSSSTY